MTIIRKKSISLIAGGSTGSVAHRNQEDMFREP
ncbi:hypothetical protein SGLAM104S_04906 [Streptomyces glaucescens]